MSRYYEPEDHERMRDATTFEEMLQIAFGIIERMPDDVGMVSGPITTGGLGSRDANIEHFQATINALQGRGFAILDQMPMERHFWRIMEDTSYYRPEDDHLLEVFYGTLFDQGLIRTLWMMPGWRGSYGATWEHARARKAGMIIRCLRDP